MSAPPAGEPGIVGSSLDPAPAVLVAAGIVKQYGGTRALDEAELTVNAGEIHGLLGENGSGKSTLIKVLAGAVVPDAGELTLFGEQVSFPLGAGESYRHGLRFVHQGLGLIPDLTVAENLLLDRFALGGRISHLSWRRIHSDATAVLAKFDLAVDPRRKVSELAPIDRSLVAIVRAVAGGDQDGGTAAARLLVLDEPTVFLPRGEVVRLFRMLRTLTGSGAGVLFVSHRMDEVREYTDRVTVLRDGRNAGTLVTAEVADDALVRLIVGTDVVEPPAAPPVDQAAEPAVRVDRLHTASLTDIELTVGRGEIIGLTGLAGAGYEEVLYSMFGAHPAARGSMTIGSALVDLRRLTPREAMAAGIALIPADRLAHGLAGVGTLEENITLNIIDKYFRRLRLRQGDLLRTAGRLAAQYKVRPPRPELTIESFSGGNQQKVLLAKWLVGAPQVLLLHEPTQGVDVGARADISGFLIELAAAGTAIVIASAEYEQLAALCSRVVIFADGRVKRVLAGDAVSKERILVEAVRTADVPSGPPVDVR